MKKLLVPLLALLLLPAVLFAAEAGDVALPTDLTGIPAQWQIYITWIVIAVKYLSEFYGSVRNGGGLRRIITSFWLGEQTPAVIAQDYKKELDTTTAPFPPKSP